MVLQCCLICFDITISALAVLSRICRVWQPIRVLTSVIYNILLWLTCRAAAFMAIKPVACCLLAMFGPMCAERLCSLLLVLVATPLGDYVSLYSCSFKPNGLFSRPKDLLIVACLPRLGSFALNGFLLRHFCLMAILFGLAALTSSKIF